MNKFVVLVIVVACSMLSTIAIGQTTFTRLYYQNVYVKATSNGKDAAPFIAYLIPRKVFISSHAEHIKSNPYQIEKQIDAIKRQYSGAEVRPADRKFIAVTFDSTAVPIVVQGINHKNASEFEYQIVQNGKTIIQPWTVPDKFVKFTVYQGYFGGKDSAKAYLGSYSAPFDSYLTVQVRRINTAEPFISNDIFWLSRAPHVVAAFRGTRLDDFVEVNKYFASTQYPLPIPRRIDSLIRVETRNGNKYEYKDNGILFYFDDIIDSSRIEYKLEGEKNTDWQIIKNQNYLWLQDLPPGKYKLRTRYTLQRQEISEFEFEILPAWYQAVFFKAGIAVLIAAGVGAIVLLINTRRVSQQRRKDKLKTEKINAELKAIRAQLNPHFIFNSLTSIQNLINKKKIDDANKYLTAFSSLTRNALKSSENEFTNLYFELNNLQNHLDLEQLRFGFSYEIRIAPDVNITEIEIPSLLLLPLVENAIKHGISKKEQGQITISVKKDIQDLSILITDNGNGYTVTDAAGGYGLKLTEERINLINQLLKDQCVQIHIQSNPDQGTRVHLIFKNWLS